MTTNTWISHYTENNSNSTGQMICLRYVFKIRTFIKETDHKAMYSIVFEGDISGSNGTVTWQYNSRAEAELTIMKVVACVEEIEWKVDNIEQIRTSQLYIDLMRGFDGGKPTRTK